MNFTFSLPDEIMSLLVNSELFLVLSGEKQYFNDMKHGLNNKMEKLIEEKKKMEDLMTDWKYKYIDRFQDIERVQYLNQQLSKELMYKEFLSKSTKEIQTDVDYYEFNNIQHNNNVLLNVKSLVSNQFKYLINKER